MSEQTAAHLPKLTDREQQLACIAWQCLKSDPSIDYDKLAKVAGFKNLQSARACMRPVMKKLANIAEAPNMSSGSPSTPSGATGKRKAAATSGKKKDPNDQDNQEGLETPSKRPKTAKSNTAAAAKVSAGGGTQNGHIKHEGDDVGLDITPVKSKPVAKAPAKSAAPAVKREKEANFEDDFMEQFIDFTGGGLLEEEI